MSDSLFESWSGRHRSTEPMKLGSVNKDAVLAELERDRAVAVVVKCGLIGCKDIPWAAVSPDALCGI